MTMMNRAFSLLAVWLISWAAGETRASDWPQWGGTPARNMYSPAKNLPYDFDPGQLRPDSEDIDLATSRNVKWAVKLGSSSYGNATISGGKVFVGTNNDNPRDARHQGDRGILMVFDEETGEFLWQLVVPKLAAGKINDWEHLGLLSSPAVDGDRVYIVTSRGEVMCLDVNGLANGNTGPFKDEAQYIAGPGNPRAELGPKDADIIWVYDMIHELGAFPHNAANSSVLIGGGLVYASTGNGQDWTHSSAPFPFAPTVIALGKETGELRGQDDAGIGFRVFHGQWGSPALGKVNGRELVLFGAGDGWCYAFDSRPADGRLELVWKYDCNPPEYKSRNGKLIAYSDSQGPSEIISTPVFFKGRVYVTTGQDPEHGEGVGRLVCIDAAQTGDISSTGTVWDYRKIHRSLSTVSIDPDTGLLFAADFSGFIHCLDAQTGAVHWVHDMKAHVWGSTLVADGKLYVGDEDGDFAVLAVDKEKKLISETNFGAPIYSTPVVANGVIYVATSTHLYALHNDASSSSRKEEASEQER
jgi:outer membrane protein assembly factor BamB